MTMSLDMMNTLRIRLSYICTAVVDYQGDQVFPCPMWVLRGIGALEEGGVKPRNFWLPSAGPTAFLTEEEMEEVTEIAGHNGIDVMRDDDSELLLEDSPMVEEKTLTVWEWLDRSEKRFAEIREKRYP